jgi:probable rRNA maturation factor
MRRKSNRAPRAAEATRVDVIVQSAVRDASVPSAAEIRRWVRVAASPGIDGEITVRIVDIGESAALNERYRGRAGPTNVLSFEAPAELPELDGERRPLGDIVVCAPVIAAEADARSAAADAHWAHIVIHGTLHLMGYDHETAPEARVMEARERELLGELGFPDPYAGEA